METLTKEKLIEILEKYVDFSMYKAENEIYNALSTEFFSLHNVEIAKLQKRLDIQINVNDKLLLELREANKRLAKYKELVEAWKTLSDMQTDDFEQGTYYNNQIKRQELRKQIETLKSEI